MGPLGRTIVVVCAVLCVFAVRLPTAGATGPDDAFTCAIQPIPDDVLDKMVGRSWKQGCPVDRSDLSYLELSYWGFDDQAHTGTIVIHKDLAVELVEIFKELYEARFPIERMQPYEDFEVDEYAAYNDTVAYYCRPAQDDPSMCSSHCYGYAIDINPLINPFLDPKLGWWPAGSSEYADRDEGARGKITLDSDVVEIMTRHGWEWGGFNADGVDYMHFRKSTIGDHKDLTKDPYLVTGMELRAK